MILLESKQKGVRFSYSPDPVTIDKSSDWGKGNLQKFPTGVYFKHDEDTGVITHGVQPNPVKGVNAPVGWSLVPSKSNIKTYDKLPIWADLEKLIEPTDYPNGKVYTLETLDGRVDYEVNETMVLVAQDENGVPSSADRWLISYKNLYTDYYEPLKFVLNDFIDKDGNLDITSAVNNGIDVDKCVDYIFQITSSEYRLSNPVEDAFQKSYMKERILDKLSK